MKATRWYLVDKPTDERMRREIQRLMKAGKMPTLDQLSAAVLEARRKLANKIRRAQREG
jgi:hypothetical protein